MSLRAELLAPAGSFLSAKAAVNAGADAVYMGGRRFGARAYAVSASSGEEDMLMEAIEYCHLFSVKVYMTLNILFKDFELKELFSYLKPYYEAGLDGVIVQDLGAASVIQAIEQGGFGFSPIMASPDYCYIQPLFAFYYIVGWL